MPDIEGLDAEGFCPRDEQSVAGFLVAVLDVGDPGVCDFNAEFGDAVGELRLTEAEGES